MRRLAESMLVVMGFGEKEPQINADERRFIESDNYEKGCQGSEKSGIDMSTYAPQDIRVRGVENPQSFVSDVHRLVRQEGIS